MQELQFVKDDSDPSSLVLRVLQVFDDVNEDGDGDHQAEFFLPVTEELTEFLGVEATGPEETEQPAPEPETPAVAAVPSEPAPAADEVPVPPHRERVHLRPREIQDRIRHGETVEEIVASTGMEERGVRPFAVPIDMERNRVAEIARNAHPVRADGPTEQPLREVLATAFGARGESLRASVWSAAMDSNDHWVISVTWTKGNREGATEFVAEFRYIPDAEGPDTVQPVNSVASDLIDPRFERPVRTVSPVVPASTSDDNPDAEPDGVDEFDTPDDTGASDEPQDVESESPEDNDNAPVDLFGRRADSEPKRKKKAVTPHWEDVLLGVRTNPRANGRNKKK
ncbi:MAG: septation protein SepH [Corynebacterium sp.]|uniref:septation protein SepH n=1 Tax=Corynebacterium sp. TaxID=1720 RepID=UPI003F9DD901